MGGESMWRPLKRWRVLLALLAGLVTVALLCLPYGSRITRASCEKVQEGMTEAEVCAILGKPWGNSLLDPEVAGSWEFGIFWPREMVACRPGEYSREWVGEDIEMFVVFNDEGQVAWASLHTDVACPRTWLPARVWRRLRGRDGW
jgi:hypothetical protein